MMFNPMGSVMRPYAKASVAQGGRVSTSKSRYAQIYERALQDKVSNQLYQQQIGNQLTPSSASYTTSISTLDLIEFVLREYEQNHSVLMQPAAQKKQSYTIYEDLKIVYQLGKEQDSITSGSFKRLSEEGYVRRTLESIKSRYNDYLKNLNKEDYQEILSYIDLNGLKGFLVFEKNEKGVRMLQRISKNDPRTEQASTNGAQTPIRSPRGHADKPTSPGMFPMSPQKHMPHPGFMPPFFYPPFQMYPHNQGNANGYMSSPYKHYIDQASQMYQMQMFMNPYMQMAQQQYPQMMAQQQRFMMQQMTGDDQEAEYEIRPSQKRSVGKAASAVHTEDEQIQPEPRKKVKGNNEDQSLNKKKEDHQLSGNTLKITQNQQIGNSSQNSSKVQSTLIFQKPFQNMSKVIGASLHPHMKDSELLRGPNAMPRALTKEVYDLISDEDRIPTENFESILDYVSEQIKMPKEKLVDTLDALSGSFKDFAVYMETKQENMLWNTEEDKILENIKSQDSSEFKLLLKLKGLPSIKKRIIYSKIEIPFQIA